MRAPRFWQNPAERPGWQARLLAPAALAWRTATRHRLNRATPRPAGVPVICIGNLTAGGTGKTPMTAWTLDALASAGVEAHVLSRGHGGRLEGPHRVDPARDRAAEVGDEPLMLAARAPVWVARDRSAGAAAAVRDGAGALVLDDGFQNPALAKDLSVVMVDAGAGFGNGRVIPAGPLREPVAEGLARADALVLLGEPDERADCLERWPLLRRQRLFEARLVPRDTGLYLQGQKVVAFAGIGRPEKFFRTLRGMGADLIARHAFPDHHAYSRTLLERLCNQALFAGAMLVTTEKDAVRLPAEFRTAVSTVMVDLVPDAPDALRALVVDAARAPDRAGE